MSGEFSRRDFFKAGSSLVAGVGASAGGLVPAQVQAVSVAGQATLKYPAQTVANAACMQAHKVVMFSYPDQASPCAAVKLGQPVPGGVGPQNDIVAYSTMCTHMGCQVVYDGAGTFKCGCHFSQFDAEKLGQMICGQATENLPRIELAYNPGNDTLTAVSVDGLLYGRQANVL
jgi:arsenite oxidase small subunit